MVFGDMLRDDSFRIRCWPSFFASSWSERCRSEELDRMFESTATRQYTRELLFSAIVELMAVVVCRISRGSPRLSRFFRHRGDPHRGLRELKGTKTAVCALWSGPPARAGRGGGATEPDRPVSFRATASRSSTAITWRVPSTESGDPRCPGGRAPGATWWSRPRPGLGYRRRALRGRPRSERTLLEEMLETALQGPMVRGPQLQRCVVVPRVDRRGACCSSAARRCGTHRAPGRLRHDWSHGYRGSPRTECAGGGDGRPRPAAAR